MVHNVGSTERYARLAAGVLAGAAAARTEGWPRAALGAVAAAGIGTALTRYCPINQALGRDSLHHRSRLEEGQRDADLRREAAMSSALGTPPSVYGDEPRVTAKNDVFGGAAEPGRS